MSKTILIVGAGANQLPVIHRARQLGLRAVAVDGNPHASGLGAADAGEAANILDPEALLRVARAYRVDGIYPAAEPGVEAAAVAATELGLPGPSPEVARRVRNKHALRQAMEQAGLPVPAYRNVRTPGEGRDAITAIGLPVIVKPSDGNASRGVTRVDALDQAAAAMDLACQRSRLGTALIESFMEGEEYNVDGLIYEGRYMLGGITAKYRSEPPNRFDLGISMPPLEPAGLQDAVTRCVSETLRAIGYLNGTTHAEVIVTPEGPRIVEIAGRPGGGRIPTDLIPLTYGMDYLADSLRIALGEAPQEQRRWQRGAAVFWIPAEPGVVESIEGLDAAQCIPGVRDVVLAAKPGATLDAIIDCETRDRVGYVLTGADSPEAAVEAARRAAATIRVRTN